MKSLSLIRQQLNFTHQQMAKYLGVNRVVVCEAEKGLRPLPSYAFIKFNELAALLVATPSSISDSSFQSNGRTLTSPQNIAHKFQRMERMARHTAETLKMKLEKMQMAYKKISAMYQALQVLSSQESSERQKQWLRVELIRACQKMMRSGPAEQLKIRIRMEMLNAQADIYGKAGRNEM